MGIFLMIVGGLVCVIGGFAVTATLTNNFALALSLLFTLNGVVFFVGGAITTELEKIRRKTGTPEKPPEYHV